MAEQAMMAFNRGTQITFESLKPGRQFGTIIKFNRKTVVMLTEDRKQWWVPPYILTQIKVGTPTQHFVSAN